MRAIVLSIAELAAGYEETKENLAEIKAKLTVSKDA